MLDIDTSEDRPVRKPAARKVVHDPMNAVGLVSLLAALLSYLPTSVAWLGVVGMAFNARFGIPSGGDGGFTLAILAGLGGVLAGLGLLIARLSRQRVVRGFSWWGVQLALVPFAIGAFGVVRAILDGTAR